jgi:hypothetical protein
MRSINRITSTRRTRLRPRAPPTDPAVQQFEAQLAKGSEFKIRLLRVRFRVFRVVSGDWPRHPRPLLSRFDVRRLSQFDASTLQRIPAVRRFNVLTHQRFNVSPNVTCIYVHLRPSTCMFFSPGPIMTTSLTFSAWAFGLPPWTRLPAIARRRDGGWWTVDSAAFPHHSEPFRSIPQIIFAPSHLEPALPSNVFYASTYYGRWILDARGIKGLSRHSPALRGTTADEGVVPRFNSSALQRTTDAVPRFNVLTRQRINDPRRR